MTHDERVDAVHALGFTPRQATFLVHVLLHGGVCLGRQYCRAAGIVRGQKSHDFFTRLLRDRFAVCYRTGRHQTRLYHLCHKRLYRAVGQPDSRYRRPSHLTLPRAIERVMVLDAVLAEPDWTWLSTESDKLSHFVLAHRVERVDLPQRVFAGRTSTTIRYFPHKWPVGLPAGARRTVFLYLVTSPRATDFRLFLEAHADLLRALPAWTLRLLVPPHLTRAVGPYRAAADDHLAAPLRPSVVDELRWYFEARRASLTARDPRFAAAARAFGTQRFQTLYGVWCRQGDRVLRATQSPVLRDALQGGRGALELQPLAHSYNHLSSLVGTA